jgi:monovalent cation/proton antiporter MnhG/PhaG subunit
MDWRDAVVGVLLAATVLLQLVSALGLLLMPNLYDRLHYLGPASTLAPVLLALAVVARESFTHQGVLTILLAAFFLAFQPVLTHATARAARIRERGDWRARDDDAVRRP